MSNIFDKESRLLFLTKIRALPSNSKGRETGGRISEN